MFLLLIGNVLAETELIVTPAEVASESNELFILLVGLTIEGAILFWILWSVWFVLIKPNLRGRLEDDDKGYVTPTVTPNPLRESIERRYSSYTPSVPTSSSSAPKESNKLDDNYYY